MFTTEFLTVSITAPPAETEFKGYFIQARAPGVTVPVGTWQLTNSSYQKLLSCTYPNNAVTQSSSVLKREALMDWVAPSTSPPSQIIF